MTANGWIRRGAWLGVAALVVVGAAWFAWPRSVAVDLATVVRGPMTVTVDDEAKTRVRHVFTVAAPVTGRVLRSPRHVGDEVVADETVVAVIAPVAPTLIDVRSREELAAALAAAEAAVTLAEHEVERVAAALAFAESERERAEALAGTEVIAVATLDRARVEVETQTHALASAKAQLDVRRSERTSLAARLAAPADPPAQPDWNVELLAPASGRVLRIAQESETVVQAGTPLIEIGDPRDLEIVADLLSTDAVQVDVGSPVLIDGWGGLPILGRVARVDPSGFVKVSALGIEEQRVRSVIDLVDPPEVWSRLGHDFRVIVHVTVWRADDVVVAPVSALFRSGEDWAVFRVEGGRARTTPVEVGRRNDREAEIEIGLSPGDLVVLHPSDRIADGSPVAERTAN